MAFVNGTWVKLFDWLRDLWREEPILRARLDAEFSGIATMLTNTGDASTWINFTPIIASTTGTLTTVASVAGRYVQIGTFVSWSASFTITTNGSGATSLDVPLPAKAAASPSGTNAPTYGKETAVTGKGLTGYNATTLLSRFTLYDGTYPGGDGRTYRVGGSYEAASTGAVTDTTPDAFTFTDITNATISTLYTSNTITIAGIDAPAAISITGGWQYAINGGAYTSTAGTVSNLSTITVQLTSSASFLTAIGTTLTIGGISDTYTVTTVAAPVTPTVVQAKSHAIEGAPISSVTLDTPPTSGNLLIAFFAHWNNGPTAGSGWTQVEMTNGITRDGSAIYSKVAGGGELAAQTPTSGSALGGTLTIFEIAGAHATWEDAHFALRDIAASTTYSRTETTAFANELIIGVIENNANSTQPTGITGVDGNDGAFSATGRAVTGFHKAAAAATTYPIVATYAANQTCVYMSVCIKPV